MLKEPLFTISSLHRHENTVHAVLDIDKTNAIFEGHFPAQPVVPGACMVQIVKEVLAKVLNTAVCLTKAENIKFLSLVEPANNQLLLLDMTYELIDNEIKVTANLIAHEVVCMKLQGVFQSTKP
jgi:3-hydroxyacyl-[acyl-carrier-protein] dehydratase